MLRRTLRLLLLCIVALSLCGARGINGSSWVASRAGLSQPKTLEILLSTGQSLSVGTGDNTCQSTTQPYANTKLCDYGFVWEPLTSYPNGYIVTPKTPTGQKLQKWENLVATCTSNSTGPYTEPSWPASPTIGVTTVSDNTCTWTYEGLAANAPFDVTAPTSSTLTTCALVCPVKNSIYSSSTEHLSYPTNIWGEDVGLGTTNAFTAKALAGGYPSFNLNDTTFGLGGASIATIEKPSNSYSAWEYEVLAIQNIRGSGNVDVFAILLTHGETDGDSTTYQADIGTYFSNLDTDINGFTGQTIGSVRKFISQQNSSPPWGNGHGPRSSEAQVHLSQDTPGTVWGTDAEYAFPHDIPLDFHLTHGGYQMLGEKNGQAMWAAYNNGAWNGSWTPLTPSKGTPPTWTSGTKTILVTFNVQTPPLIFNSHDLMGNAVADPHPSGGANGAWFGAQGFEATDIPTTSVPTGTNLGTNPITIGLASATGYPASGGTYTTPCGTGPGTISGAVLTMTGMTSCTSGWSGAAGGVIARVQAISSVSIVGSNQVAVVLANTPGTGLAVAYAWTVDNVTANANGGMSAGGRYGFLYDSDTFVGPMSGRTLPGSAWTFQYGGLT